MSEPAFPFIAASGQDERGSSPAGWRARNIPDRIVIVPDCEKLSGKRIAFYGKRRNGRKKRIIPDRITPGHAPIRGNRCVLGTAPGAEIGKETPVGKLDHPRFLESDFHPLRRRKPVRKLAPVNAPVIGGVEEDKSTHFVFHHSLIVSLIGMKSDRQQQASIGKLNQPVIVHTKKTGNPDNIDRIAPGLALIR